MKTLFSITIERGKILAKFACCGYVEFQNLDNEEKQIVLDNIYNSLPEEPVSEDLGEYINELSKQFPEVSFAKLSRIAVRVAKWQKEQFEKNRLKHCNSITNEQAELEQGFIDQHLDKHQRMPTFLDAIEYGMRLQKEKMMTKAIDVEVKVDAGGYPYIDKTIELYDYDKDVPLAKKGDRYKVILIKE